MKCFCNTFTTKTQRIRDRVIGYICRWYLEERIFQMELGSFSGIRLSEVESLYVEGTVACTKGENGENTGRSPSSTPQGIVFTYCTHMKTSIMLVSANRTKTVPPDSSLANAFAADFINRHAHALSCGCFISGYTHPRTRDSTSCRTPSGVLLHR